MMTDAVRAASDAASGSETERGHNIGYLRNSYISIVSSFDMAKAVLSGAERAGSPRGRKRDPALDAVVLEVTLHVLAELGYEGFTVNEVIARTGGSSATVYRRWATMDDLVVAALKSLAPEPVEIDTGSLDGDVGELIRHLGEVLSRHGHLSGPGALGSA